MHSTCDMIKQNKSEVRNKGAASKPNCQSTADFGRLPLFRTTEIALNRTE